MIPDKAYELGRDCGSNGANTKNCHFGIFSDPENTKAWEQGKKDAEVLLDETGEKDEK